MSEKISPQPVVDPEMRIGALVAREDRSDRVATRDSGSSAFSYSSAVSLGRQPCAGTSFPGADWFHDSGPDLNHHWRKPDRVQRPSGDVTVARENDDF
jgi:hypothetical protein